MLIRVLDTHISRHNAPNVPLELTLPYDAVVALKDLIEREYGWTEAQAEFGKGSETAFDGDRRLFEVKMTHNGRTVTISYDPSDPEAVKAAETWRKALFAPKDAPKDGNCLYVSDRVRYALDAIAYLSGNIDGRYAFIPLTDKQREAIDALYPEPAKPEKNGGEMTAAEHLKFVCDGLKAEPRRNIMDIAGSAFELRNLAKPLLAYLDKYGCDEYTGVTVTRDAVIVGKTPHTDALLFEAKFPKSENPVSLKHGTWQETLLRILDTHMARRNFPNVPLQMALPSEVVVSLRNWLLGNAT